MSYLHRYLPLLFGNKKGQSYTFPQELDWGKLSFEELLMFHTLKGSLSNFLYSLNLKSLTSFEIHHLFGFEEFLPEDFFKELRENFSDEWSAFLTAKNYEELNTKELQEILNFKTHKLSLFALLPKDRTIPGKLFIRKADGSFVHRKDGRAWSIVILGLSGRGLPFNHSNGSTPAGVYTVDSVMPEANKANIFGKNRRLIVNFIEKSADEKIIKEYLPKNHYQKSWWKPCLIGRELGRSLLRIHGTGLVNKKPLSTFYPMIPTSGCLATTEANIFGLWKRNDQRHLLDALMEALHLPKTFENESKIHGLLYVIDFDGKYQGLEFRG